MLAIFNPDTFLENDFTDKFIAQQRTSKSKQFVFLFQDCVIKGPYKKAKHDQILERYRILNAWSSPAILQPTDTFSGQSGYYFKYPNLMAEYNLNFIDHSESFSDLTYKILVDPPVKSLNKYDYLPNDIYSVLLSLCHCYILGVGNTNTRNILVTQDKTYLIDIDANTTALRQDQTFYFSKAPNKKLDCYNKCKFLYNKLVLDLQETIIPDQYMDKANLAIELLNTYAVNNVGQMNWTSLRSKSTTFSGIDFDVAKSGLQKYIRRQETDKAVILAFEMYRMGEVGGSPGVTNLYNRLAVIANEDISPSNIGIILAVTRLVQQKDRDLNKLLWSVKELSKCSKTRLMSHAWRAYGTEEGRRLNDRVDLNYDEDYINKNINHPMFINDEIEMKRVTLMFLLKLKHQDYNAFSWASIFLEKFGKEKVTARTKFVNNAKYKTSYADVLLWRALGLILDARIHDVLVESYYEHSDKSPFLRNAILIALNKLVYEDYELNSELYPKLSNLYLGNYQIEIDDYVIDKHTRQGRNNGKTIQDFVDEGAIVIPQDPDYYDEVLEEIYRNRF